MQNQHMITVSVKLNVALEQELRQFCKEQGLGMSETCRDSLRRFLEARKQEAHAKSSMLIATELHNE